VELVQRIVLPAGVEWQPDVLQTLQALQAVPGTLSMGAFPALGDAGQEAGDSALFPPFPVNGHGSFVSGVPTAQGLRWYAGSTFQSNPDLHADLEREHAINLHKLQALLPRVAGELAPQFANQQVQAWQGTRCVSHDRLPLVGPLDAGPAPSLWLSAAMGARGLSFSALCAELLVAALGGEPLPVESALAKALSTRRTMRKKRLSAPGVAHESASGFP
jgi:tRNA 5-methylaminomethyl-2-thiouridine biosynthesis bifunctional protein